MKLPAGITGLRNSVLEGCKIGAKRKIYVSRGKAARRRVVNEESILPILKKNGYEAVNMEDYDLRGQACLFASAHAIVSAHGAALTNLIYCEQGTQVLELFSHHKRPFYYALSCQVGLQYRPLLCEYGATPQNNLESQEADLFVDPACLEEQLRKMSA